jgi:hypothetical protein
MGQLVVAQMSGGLGSQPCGSGSEAGTMQGACSIVVRDVTLSQLQQAPVWLS